MNHPNVLRIEGVAPDLFACCMVSRWMENGNVLEYLNQYQGHIDRLELVSSHQSTAHVRFTDREFSSYLVSSTG